MKKFECRCLGNFIHINKGRFGSLLVDLKKDKYYTCEYLSTLDVGFNSFKIRVYDGNRFIYFYDKDQFSNYFDYNQYLRKQKLKKLNLAISTKNNKI